MSEIDWDKAPEGATHYVNGSICPFEKRDGDDWYYWKEKSSVWIKIYNVSGDERIKKSTMQMIERPSPAWSGEGLPPVGTVCLHKHNSTERMRVCAVDGKWAAMSSESSKFWCQINELLPIRTPEQIAADEREVAFHTAICDVEEKVAEWNTTIDCSAAIKATIDVMISLGYRKP